MIDTKRQGDKHDTTVNELGRDAGVEASCMGLGFTDGGLLNNQNADIRYFICFDYEDEQGNDCNTITSNRYLGKQLEQEIGDE